MSKIIMGFLLGAASGVLGLLLTQSMSSDASAKREASDAESMVPAKWERELAFSKSKLAELEKENAELHDKLSSTAVSADTGAGDGEDAEEQGGEKKKTLIDLMMAFGGNQAKKKAEAQIRQLAERLGLDGQQEALALAAMEEKLELQQEAGAKLMKGEATFDDLTASDEDNYSAFDEKMAEILSDEQGAEYAAVQEEREIKRVEKKSTEDLQGLDDAANLTEEQKDLAWDIFVKVNAEDKPGNIPEGMTMDNFEGFVDGEIGKRLDLLEPILTDEQHGAYGTQVEGFKKMIVELVSRGTASGGEE